METHSDYTRVRRTSERRKKPQEITKTARHQETGKERKEKRMELQKGKYLGRENNIPAQRKTWRRQRGKVGPAPRRRPEANTAASRAERERKQKREKEKEKERRAMKEGEWHKREADAEWPFFSAIQPSSLNHSKPTCNAQM